jgi:hypothetical protein
MVNIKYYQIQVLKKFFLTTWSKIIFLLIYNDFMVKFYKKTVLELANVASFSSLLIISQIVVVNFLNFMC